MKRQDCKDHISSLIQNLKKGLNNNSLQQFHANAQTQPEGIQLSLHINFLKSKQSPDRKVTLSNDKISIRKMIINGQDIKKHYSVQGKEQIRKRALKSSNYSITQENQLQYFKTKPSWYLSPNNKAVELFVHNQIRKQSNNSHRKQIPRMTDIQTCRKQIQQRIVENIKTNRTFKQSDSPPTSRKKHYNNQQFLKLRKILQIKNKKKNNLRQKVAGDNRIQCLLSQHRQVAAVLKKNKTQQIEQRLIKYVNSAQGNHRDKSYAKNIKTIDVEKTEVDKLWLSNLQPWQAENLQYQ